MVRSEWRTVCAACHAQLSHPLEYLSWELRPMLFGWGWALKNHWSSALPLALSVAAVQLGVRLLVPSQPWLSWLVWGLLGTLASSAAMLRVFWDVVGEPPSRAWALTARWLRARWPRLMVCRALTISALLLSSVTCIGFFLVYPVIWIADAVATFEGRSPFASCLEAARTSRASSVTILFFMPLSGMLLFGVLLVALHESPEHRLWQTARMFDAFWFTPWHAALMLGQFVVWAAWRRGNAVVPEPFYWSSDVLVGSRVERSVPQRVE